MGLRATDEELNELFAEVDANGDGLLQQQEVVACFKRLMAAVFSYDKATAHQLKIMVAAKRKAEALQMAAAMVDKQVEDGLAWEQQQQDEAAVAKLAQEEEKRAREKAARKEEAKIRLKRTTNMAFKFLDAVPSKGGEDK